MSLCMHALGACVGAIGIGAGWVGGCGALVFVHSLSFSRVAAQRGWNFNEMTPAGVRLFGDAAAFLNAPIHEICQRTLYMVKFMCVSVCVGAMGTWAIIKRSNGPPFRLHAAEHAN
jgi:hypothetical protein